MTRLNYNRPKRTFTPWYEADILPWDARLQAPAPKPRAIARPKPTKRGPTQGMAAASATAIAHAFSGKALLRTSDLFEARDVLYGASEAVVFCDGAASPNPGRMGFGAVILTTGGRVEMFAGGMSGTNNIAELASAQMAIKALPAGCRVRVISDSQYLIRGATEWAQSRLRKLQRGVVVPNADLWRAIDSLNATRSIRWEWVRGHNGNRGNEIADQLATLGRAQP